jgi:hypothetical protein
MEGEQRPARTAFGNLLRRYRLEARSECGGRACGSVRDFVDVATQVPDARGM